MSNNYDYYDEDLFKQTMNSLMHVKEISDDEVNLKIHQFKISNQDERNEAWNALSRKYIREIVEICNGYLIPSIEMMDLIQDCYLVMLDALKKFDPKRGCSFITYLVNKIKPIISRFFDKYANLIHRPEKKVQLLCKINKFRNEYFDNNGVEPSENLLAETFGVTHKELLTLMFLNYDFIPLDKGSNAEHMSDDAFNPVKTAEDQCMYECIHEALGCLTQEELLSRMSFLLTLKKSLLISRWPKSWAKHTISLEQH